MLVACGSDNNRACETLDSNTMIASILNQKASRFPNPEDRLLQPATDEQIRGAQCEIGVAFSPDLVGLYKAANGQQIKTGEFFNDRFYFFGLDQALEERRDMMAEWDTPKSDNSPLSELPWHPHWFPFARDIAGVTLCVDLRQGIETSGHVIVNSLESPAELHAVSVGEFLKKDLAAVDAKNAEFMELFDSFIRP